jgi:hypothetical protein
LKVQVGSDGSRRASAGKGRSHVTARPSYRMSLPRQVQPPVPRGERKRGGAQRLPGRRIKPREGLRHSFRDGQWRHKQGGGVVEAFGTCKSWATAPPLFFLHKFFRVLHITPLATGEHLAPHRGGIQPRRQRGAACNFQLVAGEVCVHAHRTRLAPRRASFPLSSLADPAACSVAAAVPSRPPPQRAFSRGGRWDVWH